MPAEIIAEIGDLDEIVVQLQKLVFVGVDDEEVDQVVASLSVRNSARRAFLTKISANARRRSCSKRSLPARSSRNHGPPCAGESHPCPVKVRRQPTPVGRCKAVARPPAPSDRAPWRALRRPSWTADNPRDSRPHDDHTCLRAILAGRGRVTRSPEARSTGMPPTGSRQSFGKGHRPTGDRQGRVDARPVAGSGARRRATMPPRRKSMRRPTASARAWHCPFSVGRGCGRSPASRLPPARPVGPRAPRSQRQPFGSCRGAAPWSCRERKLYQKAAFWLFARYERPEIAKQR